MNAALEVTEEGCFAAIFTPSDWISNAKDLLAARLSGPERLPLSPLSSPIRSPH